MTADDDVDVDVDEVDYDEVDYGGALCRAWNLDPAKVHAIRVAFTAGVPPRVEVELVSDYADEVALHIQRYRLTPAPDSRPVL